MTAEGDWGWRSKGVEEVRGGEVEEIRGNGW